VDDPSQEDSAVLSDTRVAGVNGFGLGMAIIKASSSRLMRRSWDHYDVS
jgi:hypothetical protein